MMISPESFVEFELKGKSQEEVFKIIGELKDEIERLKEIVEKHDIEDYMIKPSPDVQLSVNKDYLKAAKRYCKAQGWSI